VGLRQMLLGGTDEHDLTTLAEYQSIGGYGQVEKARAMTADVLIAELQKANLRGRGGAGFPMGRKASLLDRKSPKPKYLVVNADESEPGAFKDREVMAKAPHRLLEGCLIAAHAIESLNVFIYIRGEYLTEYEILQRAVDEARAAGIFGDVEVTVYRGAGAYICGEETALLDSLEGRRGQPRPRPPFPPIQGLYAAPTQINNVCTIATVPAILELGPDGFTSIGTPGSPGTVLFSISGNVERPGNYELELGTSMRELIYTHAGGIAGGRQLKAVIPGGSSVPALTARQIDVPLDYDSLGAIGTFFGAASLIVVDDRCCMVQLALRSTKFYMHESCGKCTPCRADRGRRRDRARPRAAAQGLRPHRGQVPVRAGRLRRMAGAELHGQMAGRVRRARRAGPLPPRRRVVDRRHLRALRPAHPRPGGRGARVTRCQTRNQSVTRFPQIPCSGRKPRCQTRDESVT
jgi:NADH-quinone oxidoreductase subunit F